MDIRHSFLRCKISRLYSGALAFPHVLELNALEVGLQMLHALHHTKDNKQHIGSGQA